MKSQISYTALNRTDGFTITNPENLIHRLSAETPLGALQPVMSVLPAAALQLQDVTALQTRGVCVRVLLGDVPALLTAHAVLLIPAQTKRAP